MLNSECEALRLGRKCSQYICKQVAWLEVFHSVGVLVNQIVEATC